LLYGHPSNPREEHEHWAFMEFVRPACAFQG
jgi:hypothetical protein